MRGSCGQRRGINNKHKSYSYIKWDLRSALDFTVRLRCLNDSQYGKIVDWIVVLLRNLQHWDRISTQQSA